MWCRSCFCVLIHCAAVPQCLRWLLQVDVGVIEAGLGGVRDATNVFSPGSLKLSIIAPIGWEHVKPLGRQYPTCYGCKLAASLLSGQRNCGPQSLGLLIHPA